MFIRVLIDIIQKITCRATHKKISQAKTTFLFRSKENINSGVICLIISGLFIVPGTQGIHRYTGIGFRVYIQVQVSGYTYRYRSQGIHTGIGLRVYIDIQVQVSGYTYRYRSQGIHRHTDIGLRVYIDIKVQVSGYTQTYRYRSQGIHRHTTSAAARCLGFLYSKTLYSSESNLGKLSPLKTTKHLKVLLTPLFFPFVKC